MSVSASAAPLEIARLFIRPDLCGAKGVPLSPVRGLRYPAAPPCVLCVACAVTIVLISLPLILMVDSTPSKWPRVRVRPRSLVNQRVRFETEPVRVLRRARYVPSPTTTGASRRRQESNTRLFAARRRNGGRKDRRDSPERKEWYNLALSRAWRPADKPPQEPWQEKRITREKGRSGDRRRRSEGTHCRPEALDAHPQIGSLTSA